MLSAAHIEAPNGHLMSSRRTETQTGNGHDSLNVRSMCYKYALSH